MQLDENTEPLRCTIWVAKLMSGFQIIVLGIPAVVLTLVSMALCPCMVPSCGNTNRERGESSCPSSCSSLDSQID
jgi:hypothetical protein